MGGSLRSGMDHVPGTGPHRVGMVTPSVESLHNPTQFGFDSTLDAVSRHCEKKLRCPIQSCLDAIKHIYIYIYIMVHNKPSKFERIPVNQSVYIMGCNKGA